MTKLGAWKEFFFYGVGGGHKFLYHNRDDKNTGEDMNMYCTIAITNPFKQD